MNLVLNAVEASPDGGTVIPRGAHANESVCIDIENSGDPIPQARLCRVFEPFFTTKPQGTGLGASHCPQYRARARRRPGIATNGPQRICFSLILPMPEPVRGIRRDRNQIQMGRILLVDDEPSMRRILASNLRQDQHEIFEACGRPRGAIQLWRQTTLMS